jgi:hypothetical protein
VESVVIDLATYVSVGILMTAAPALLPTLVLRLIGRLS